MTAWPWPQGYSCGSTGSLRSRCTPGWSGPRGYCSSLSIWTWPGSQSPEGVGRSIAALARDPDLLTMTGRVLTVEDLAARYGIDVSA